jgi:hypothetical protein
MADAMDTQQDFSQDANSGFTEYLGWDIFEYPKYERGRMWFLGMGIGGGGLLIYAVLTANFLFALIIIMFALVTYMSSVGEPKKIRFSVTDAGISIGNTFYMYRDINRYWFIYEPPAIRSLYLEFKNALRPRVTVDLGDMNPNQVRQVLANFVREDFNEDEEPLSDYLGRVLKI